MLHSVQYISQPCNSNPSAIHCNKEKQNEVGKTYLARQKQICITDLPARKSPEFSWSFSSKKLATQLDLQLNIMLSAQVCNKSQYLATYQRTQKYTNKLNQSKKINNDAQAFDSLGYSIMISLHFGVGSPQKILYFSLVKSI